tara:strand:+ start:908 stop:2137 length:1230 start_codon:yes stop_codon:yes gene_type:complete
MALKKSQQSLKNWTEQEWTTKSGKKSSKTGERYLPKAAIENLTDEEYAATTAAKRKGTKKGKQTVAQPKKIADKTKQYRTMKKGGKAKTYKKGGKVSNYDLLSIPAGPERQAALAQYLSFSSNDINSIGVKNIELGQFYEEGGEVKKKGKFKKALKKVGRVLAGKAPEDGSKDYLLGNKKRRARDEKDAKEMFPKSGGSASAKKAMERRRSVAGARNLYKLEKKVDDQVGVMGKPLNEDQIEANKTRRPGREIKRYRARPVGRATRMRTLLTEPGKLVKKQLPRQADEPSKQTRDFFSGGAVAGGALSAVGSKLLSGEKMDLKDLGRTALGGALTGAGGQLKSLPGNSIKKAVEEDMEKGGKFKDLVRKLMKKGKSKKNAQGIAAIAGRKKYGPKKFAAMGRAGRSGNA